MPTYDYECTKCGHAFDAFQNMSDNPLVKCPSCGKNGLKRLIGAGLGVIFKGSGFYSTDSRGGSGGAKTKTAAAGDSKSESGASSDSSNSSSGGSDSSTSPKTETKKTESKAKS